MWEGGSAELPPLSEGGGKEKGLPVRVKLTNFSLHSNPSEKRKRRKEGRVLARKLNQGLGERRGKSKVPPSKPLWSGKKEGGEGGQKKGGGGNHFPPTPNDPRKCEKERKKEGIGALTSARGKGNRRRFVFSPPRIGPGERGRREERPDRPGVFAEKRNFVLSSLLFASSRGEGGGGKKEKTASVKVWWKGREWPAQSNLTFSVQWP